jgi:hypothetical protein
MSNLTVWYDGNAHGPEVDYLNGTRFIVEEFPWMESIYAAKWQTPTDEEQPYIPYKELYAYIPPTPDSQLICTVGCNGKPDYGVIPEETVVPEPSVLGLTIIALVLIVVKYRFTVRHKINLDTR